MDIAGTIAHFTSYYWNYATMGEKYINKRKEEKLTILKAKIVIMREKQYKTLFLHKALAPDLSAEGVMNLLKEEGFKIIKYTMANTSLNNTDNHIIYVE